MAAVLYQWSEEVQETEDSGGAEEDDSLKTTSVEEFVREADIDVVRSYMVSLLKEDEKLLLRFQGMVKKGTTKEDIKRYIRQIDRITDRYLGRDGFIKLVTGSPGLNMLQQYEDVLKKDYPGELLQKYKEEVDKMAMRTGDRSKYRQLVALLCRMKKITGGSKVAEEIAAEWRGKYRNRRAMLDELGRL